MTGWCQVPATAGGGQRAVEHAEEERGMPVRISCEPHSRRADQRRKYRSLLGLSQHLEEGVVAQSWMLSELDRGGGDEPRRMTYLDVKEVIERKLALQKH